MSKEEREAWFIYCGAIVIIVGTVALFLAAGR